MLNANVVAEELQQFRSGGMDIDWFYWDREATSAGFWWYREVFGQRNEPVIAIKAK